MAVVARRGNETKWKGGGKGSMKKERVKQGDSLCDERGRMREAEGE